MLILSTVTLLTGSAFCQNCHANWLRGFDGALNGHAYASTLWDPDGLGPQTPVLVAGGYFTQAQGKDANHIAMWDGKEWHALGEGLDGIVTDLIVFDDGNGPALHASLAGSGQKLINGVAKWTGSSWTQVGNHVDGVATLCSFDDGRGPKLYIGGGLTHDGAIVANGIAKLEGGIWSEVAGGVSGGAPPPDAWVAALHVHDDGSGPKLYVGGYFTSAGGIPTNGLAIWDGSMWSTFEAQLSGNGFLGSGVFGFGTSHNGDLVVCGDFTAIGDIASNKVASWNGKTWVSFGTGLTGYNGASDEGAAICMASFDDGDGLSLFVGGTFVYADGQEVSGIAKWNGKSWSALRCGVTSQSHTIPEINELIVFNDGSGEGLYLVGEFDGLGGGFDGPLIHSDHIGVWGCDPCPADIFPNQPDGVVNVDDLLRVINTWTSAACSPRADMMPPGGNGTVDVDDLLLVINSWGQCP